MSFIKHFARNGQRFGRDFVVGDIHGHFSRLEAALSQVGFQMHRDRLFSVGDLVDCGPESHRVIEWLEKPWFHPVRGNHEDMAIRWPGGSMDAARYAANGGAWNVGNTPIESREIAVFLGELPIAIEVETANGLLGIVHADCPFRKWSKFVAALDDPTLPNKIRKAVFESAMWSRHRIETEDTSGVPGVRAVIVGHTPLRRPAILGNVYYIDTAGWRPDGYFTFIDLATLRTIPPPTQTLDWGES